MGSDRGERADDGVPEPAGQFSHDTVSAANRERMALTEHDLEIPTNARTRKALRDRHRHIE